MPGFLLDLSPLSLQDTCPFAENFNMYTYQAAAVLFFTDATNTVNSVTKVVE